jgi:hypothetical protein
MGPALTGLFRVCVSEPQFFEAHDIEAVRVGVGLLRDV